MPRRVLAVLGLISALGVGGALAAPSRGASEPMMSAAQELLDRQLAMTGTLWGLLQENGVTEETSLRLDFAFVASDKAVAQAMVVLLKQETDYEVAAPVGSGPPWSRTWTVSGSTQLTTVSRAILDGWVGWMVTAGATVGCAFDGWGVEIPS